MKILLTSSKRSLCDLAQVFIGRSCGDLDAVLPERSLHDIVEVLSEDLVAILVRSSPRGPCMMILQMPCMRGVCVKALLGCSWEVVVPRSCKQQHVICDDLVRFCGGPDMKILVKILYDSL